MHECEWAARLCVPACLKVPKGKGGDGPDSERLFLASFIPLPHLLLRHAAPMGKCFIPPSPSAHQINTLPCDEGTSLAEGYLHRCADEVQASLALVQVGARQSA